MKKPQFAKNHFYHVYNRGVEKRTLFLDDADHQRFLHDLFEFNDKDHAGKFSGKKQSEVVPPIVKERKKLVNIHCFCLMPNHYHLILEQVADNGITLFMKKLGTGYAMYFNERYERTGTLFQGRFKAILVENDTYLTHLSRYIHLNPVELIDAGWKEKGVRDWEKAEKFLQSYQWSSYLDYIGIQNYPSVIKKDFISAYFGGKEKEYKKFVKEWAVKDLARTQELIIEK